MVRFYVQRTKLNRVVDHFPSVLQVQVLETAVDLAAHFQGTSVVSAQSVLCSDD
jgi:hypothetical protein